ncbi:MAG: hypothetical protein CBC94_000375 [Gammaproteobacteria bacterium TMED134]|nr:MAG: hypothetical protein CBC94_000375 [Gammaproteobacteria bacterium TMED134]RZO71654.1 MAG: hypothetical protein EVA67_04320 [OM182 bacterium]HBK17375.1 hypothetical protein [Gammaproteobacteria bacterium]|tara:strand:- start:7432 stop:8085 length:654 start_codon:yes stop_codon:yes gene_type:complete
MNHWLHILLITLLLGGCVNSTVQQVRERETGIVEGQSVVILGVSNRPSATETEVGFIDCVAGDLERSSSEIRVIPVETFKDLTFPWFEPRTAPDKANQLPALLAKPRLAAQLDKIGLRYLVWVDGRTRRTSSAGSIGCSIAPGGGGCFGFLTWDEDASYEATIWDTEDGRTAGRISSDAEGTSYMPALVVPIPIIARVQNNACKSLSDQLQAFLVNK